ncbi:MAG: GGDEF domain-containing protein [Eubacterium sp.]|nr:GGDEF domain-containing protein [Eubacterium sp.]
MNWVNRLAIAKGKLSILGRILIAAAVTALGCLLVYTLKIPNPNLILFQILNVALVLFGYQGGIGSGVVVLFYSMFFFSDNGSFFYYSGVNLQKVIVTAICIVTNVFLVGNLYKSLIWRLEMENNELKESEIRDDLSGAKNRSALRRDFPGFVGKKLCVAMLDVDDFKKFNDEAGHLCGDDVIRQVGAALRKYFNRDCYRYGGDEFLIASSMKKEEFESRLKNAVRDITSIAPKGTDEKISITAGYTTGFSGNMEDVRKMIADADEALYRGKNSPDRIVEF